MVVAHCPSSLPRTIPTNHTLLASHLAQLAVASTVKQQLDKLLASHLAQLAVVPRLRLQGRQPRLEVCHHVLHGLGAPAGRGEKQEAASTNRKVDSVLRMVWVPLGAAKQDTACADQ